MQGNKAAFLLRQNTGYQDGNYGLIAGHVVRAESYKTAILREALEETGITLAEQDLSHVHTMHRYSSPDNIRLDVFFKATKWRGDPVNREPNKHAEIAWLNIEKLPANVQDYTAFAIKELLKGRTYSEFGWDVTKTHA